MAAHYEFENVKPMDIEKRSFEIIGEELADMGLTLDPEKELIVKRCIHTAADFDYARNLVFSEGVVPKAIEAFTSGCSVITDTMMAYSGINKKAFGKFGGKLYNFMSDEDVAATAKERGETRASVCMDKTVDIKEPMIYVIGNAPTALIRIRELYDAGKINPALVIGVPVGFVNVEFSKELIIDSDMPYIVARGRKGGSNIAAAICNALMYMGGGR